MSEARALKLVFDRSDEGFFRDHLDRKSHIRNPYRGESEGEFWQLGEHDRNRRRILLWKVPEDNPHYQELKKKFGGKLPLLKIPFLAYADETIEDTDAVLLPIIHELMLEAAK